MEKVLNRLLLRNGSHWESSEVRAGLHSSGSLCPGMCLSQPGFADEYVDGISKSTWYWSVFTWQEQPHLVCMGTYEAVCAGVYSASHYPPENNLCWLMWCLVMPCRSTPGCFRTGSSSTGHKGEQEARLENILDLFQVWYSLESEVPENWRCIKTWDNFGELFLARRQNGKFKCSV